MRSRPLRRQSPIPVIGNGDVLFGHEVEPLRARAGCAGVMTARGALIRPWLFREVTEGYRDLSADERLTIYRRYVTLAREHWGNDEHGLARVRTFTRWHLGFWCRDVRRREDGTFPSMQVRERELPAQSPLDALLTRTDAATHDYLTECLVMEREIVPDDAPAAGAEQESPVLEAEG